MSEFVERLEELMFERNLTRKKFAEISGVDAASVTLYLNERRLPTVENAVKIADFFNCSTDYLLGREDVNHGAKFKSRPPFCQRLKFLKERFNRSAYSIYTGTGISKSSYYEWLSGKRQPSLDNVIRLADYFGCTVDFVLGRE